MGLNQEKNQHFQQKFEQHTFIVTEIIAGIWIEGLA
jgi:hypothetical protein